MLLPAATLLLGLADPEVHRYLEYMKNTMRLYDVSPLALEHADDILDLEISLAVVSVTRIYVYSMFLGPSSHFFEQLKINKWDFGHVSPFVKKSGFSWMWGGV